MICAFGFSRGAGYSMALARALPKRVVAIGAGGSAPSWFRLTNAVERGVCEIPIMAVQGSEDALAGTSWFQEFDAVRGMGFRVALAKQWGLSHYEGDYENVMLIHFDTAIGESSPGLGPTGGACNATVHPHG